MARRAWTVSALSLALVGGALPIRVLAGLSAWEPVFLAPLVALPLVGGVVASRRPTNRVGWLLLGAGASFAIVNLADAYAVLALLRRPAALPGALPTAWLANWTWVPALMLTLCFLPLYFPTGRLPSQRWRWVARLAVLITCLGCLGAAFVTAGYDSGRGTIANPLAVPLPTRVRGLLDAASGAALLVAVVIGAVSLIVRSRGISGEDRQQLKWLTYAVALVPPLTGLGIVTGLGDPLMFLGLAGIPVAVGVAVLRYRLYDIDRVISRTVSYGLLTAALAAVYIGGVALLAPLAGDSDLAVAGSTLAVAALFGPARGRVQAAVDRRFNRARYDARRTVDGFSARLRDEVDLDGLSAELVAVVGQTMQPVTLGLWLRERPSEIRLG